MKFYNMLSAVAYIVGTYRHDSPLTISESSPYQDGWELRVNSGDLELGVITVTQFTEELRYEYEAVAHTV